MADRYWVGSDSSWNTSGNWSTTSGGSGGAGVPTSSDDVYFDGSDTTSCTLDVNAACLSLTIGSGYTGTFDADTFNISITNDCTLDGTGVDMGDGTWTVGGNWDNLHVTTFNRDSSTLVLTGTSKTVTAKSSLFRHVTISGTISVAAASSTFSISGSLIISAGKSLTIPSGETVIAYSYDTNSTQIQSGASITGAGTFSIGDGGRISQQDGTIDTAVFLVTGRHGDTKSGILAGTYASASVIFKGTYTTTYTIPFLSLAGTYTFTGDVQFASDDGVTYTINNSTNNPNWVFQGDVEINEVGTSSVLWTRGTGTVYLSPTATAQAIDFNEWDMEDIEFEASSSANGVVIETNLNCRSLTMVAGVFECSTYDPDITVDGDVTMDNETTSMGDGTWTVGGDFDFSGITTLTDDASTLIMTGTSKSLNTNLNQLYNVTFSGSTTIVNNVVSLGKVIISTSKTVSVNVDKYLYIYGTAANRLVVNTGGSITGSGQLWIGGNCGIQTMDGTIDCSRITFDNTHDTADRAIVPATYASSTVVFRAATSDRTFVSSAGTYTFSGNVFFSCYTVGTTYTINNSTNNANWIFKGTVTFDGGAGGTVVWTKGTGTITLSGAGSGTQTIDFNDQTVEDIVINDTGATKQFTDGWVSDSFTLTAGTVDVNGQTIETTGDFTAGTDGQFTPTGFNGSDITVGGNLSLSGESGDLLNMVATSGWTLDVTGTATAVYTDVAYSDASAGTKITASDGTSTDSGNNTNWAFSISGTSSLSIPSIEAAFTAIKVWDAVFDITTPSIEAAFTAIKVWGAVFDITTPSIEAAFIGKEVQAAFGITTPIIEVDFAVIKVIGAAFGITTPSIEAAFIGKEIQAAFTVTAPSTEAAFAAVKVIEGVLGATIPSVTASFVGKEIQAAFTVTTPSIEVAFAAVKVAELAATTPNVKASFVGIRVQDSSFDLIMPSVKAAFVENEISAAFTVTMPSIVVNFQVEVDSQDDVIEDYTARAEQLLITQFQRKRPVVEINNNVITVLNSFVSEVQAIEYVLRDLKILRWLHSSLGEQLDKIGDILNEERLGKTDEQYRASLITKVFASGSHGESRKITDFFKDITGSEDVSIHELQPASFYLTGDGETLLNLQDTIISKIEEVAAAGVTVQVYYRSDPSAVFAFDGEGILVEGQGFGETNYLPLTPIGGHFSELIS